MNRDKITDDGMKYFFNHTDKFKKASKEDPKVGKSYRRHYKIKPIVKGYKNEALNKIKK